MDRLPLHYPRRQYGLGTRVSKDGINLRRLIHHFSRHSVTEWAGGLFVEHDTQAFDISLPELTASAFGWRDVFVEALTIKVRRMLHHQPLSPGPAADPLTMRAWAYQERLLSPRILHYTSEEFVWECKTSCKCECGGGRFDIGSSKAQYDEMCCSYSPDYGEFSSWHTLISAYTKLSLTYDKDRLPAFSGIAKQLVSNRHYLAGLRRKSLVLDLSWKTTHVREPGPQGVSFPSGQYRAPSWSWASVGSPVTYERVISNHLLGPMRLFMKLSAVHLLQTLLE